MATTAFSPINCGTLPGRKRPSLYVIEDGQVRVLATFQDKEAMDAFLAYKPRVNFQPGRPSAALGPEDD